MLCVTARCSDWLVAFEHRAIMSDGMCMLNRCNIIMR